MVPHLRIQSVADVDAILAEHGIQSLPGLNVQEPWATQLACGKKTIETRTYACPQKFLSTPIGLVATRRPHGEKAALVGIVRILRCQRYESLAEFRADELKHLITPECEYDWVNRQTPKWGWEVSLLATCITPLPLQGKRGIVWSSAINFLKTS